MATQTGSIDLTASNSVKLAAEAGWQSDLGGYYTKSEIDVTVSGINSTVSTKVGEDEVISSINQSSESVSINASKINLTGAVTISDLASDASTALTGAAETATSYVTELTGEDGIMVHPSDDDDTGVQITSDVDIMRGGTSVINIGTDDAARIGKESGAHVTVQSDGVRVLDVIDNAVTGVVKLTGSSATGFYNRVASVEMEGKNGTALRMKASVNDDRAIILDSGFNAKVTVKSNDSASSYGPGDAYSGHAFIDLEGDGLSINGTTVDMDAEVLVALQSVPKTALPLDTTLCQAYSSEQTPYYEKRAGMVIVSGAIKPKDTVAAGGSLGRFATLPAGCRPVQQLAVLCQGSNSYVWLLDISTSGELSASRYRYGNTNGSMSTNTWLPFHVVFPAQ